MIRTILRMQKFRGKYEKPKLSDILEPQPLKVRIYRGIIGLVTAIFVVYQYVQLEYEKVSVDELFKAGMHRYHEGVYARDEYLAQLIKDTSEDRSKDKQETKQ